MEEFIWLEKYKTKNGTLVSEQRDMREATLQELNRWRKHASSMLTNQDVDNPGRYLVKDELVKMRNRVAAEINARELRKNGDKGIDLVQLLKYDPKMIHDKCKYPTDDDSLISALLMKGDKFNKRRFSVKLFLSFGMNFTKEEMNRLLQKVSEQLPTVTDVVNKELNLHDTTRFIKRPDGLTFNELSILLNLKSKEYNALTTTELELIHNKLIGKLEDEVNKHINFWEKMIKQLDSVINTR